VLLLAVERYKTFEVSHMTDEAAKSKSCCDMRRKVAVGIAKVFSKEECGLGDEVMLDFHHFEYSSPAKVPVAAALAFKFCPWCGTRRDNSNMEARATEVIRQIKPEEDEDPGEQWKKGGTDEE
jgi:hypothetical protein